MVKPRIQLVPTGNSSCGDEAVAFCASIGLVLDPWQAHVLRGGLGRNGKGWAADEVGLTVARQNGKSVVLLGRELFGLFELGERTVIHSAHEWSSALEVFLSMIEVVESSDDLSRRVRRIRRGAGEMGIDLVTGERIRFRTRTKGGGRGWSCSLLALDEAHTLPAAVIASLVPTLATRQAQIWFAGSAVDMAIHEHGFAFSHLRERARTGEVGRLAYFEWSPEVPVADGREIGPDAVTDEFLDDEENIRAANPALEVGRLTKEAVALERRAMPRRNFAVERLSVGDHPTSLVSEGPISRRLWDRLVDEHSQPGKTLTVACDIVKGRASIGVASIREDGRIHAGLVASNLQVEGVGPDDPGFFKVLAELCATHATDDVVRIDGKVVWESVLELMESVSYSRVREYSTEEMTSACERFVNLCNEDRIRHVGSETMADVIKGAKVREVGDSFMWSRRHSAGDVAPLIAVTLAAAAAADGITDADKIWIF